MNPSRQQSYNSALTPVWEQECPDRGLSTGSLSLSVNELKQEPKIVNKINVASRLEIVFTIKIPLYNNHHNLETF